MDEIKYRKKKQFMKKRLGVFAAAIVLIIGVSMVGIQYTRFVSKTVYQESTSHLTEIFHQSNKALNLNYSWLNSINAENRIVTVF